LRDLKSLAKGSRDGLAALREGVPKVHDLACNFEGLYRQLARVECPNGRSRLTQTNTSSIQWPRFETHMDHNQWLASISRRVLVFLDHNPRA
jgi:hypothetical protein